jgi:ABC-type sugar transport system ATPase subunit
MIRELKSKDVSIIFVSHRMRVDLQIADRGVGAAGWSD